MNGRPRHGHRATSRFAAAIFPGGIARPTACGLELVIEITKSEPHADVGPLRKLVQQLFDVEAGDDRISADKRRAPPSSLTWIRRFMSARLLETSRIRTGTPWDEKNAAAALQCGHPRLMNKTGSAIMPATLT